ncbi:MAG: hypothetical protein FWG51_02345 [Firmicutes bacterium]|nr:hypothetical protein [Bacillota bacterium]
MKFYLSTIIICIAAILTVNHFIAPVIEFPSWLDFLGVADFPIWFNFLGVIGSAIAVIVIHGLCAHVSHKNQHKINPFSRYFTVTMRQHSFYPKLGVKKFKNLLPDLGLLVKFPKRKILDPKSKEYLYFYLLESCSGERGHFFAIFAGFLIVFIFPLKYFLCFGIPIATVNAVLALMPLIALRYNRFNLQSMYKILESRENQKKNSEANITP